MLRQRDITSNVRKFKLLHVLMFKAAPWDVINFRFQLRNEVVYPTDHVFISLKIPRASWECTI